MKRWIKKIIVRIREGYLKEIYKETVWMYQYVKRYWFSICFYILAGVFGTVMGLGSSVVSKYLIDAVTGVRKDKILLFAVLIICMTAAGIISNAVISRISARINVVIQNEIQADIFQKLLYTEWKELQQFRSGDLLNRLSNDAVQVASGVISWIPNSITKLVQFIGAFAIIFYYDPVMAGIALLSAPVTVIFSRKFMICYKTASRVMIFSISTSLTIVCNQCKTPCSTILLRNTGGNIPTLVTMAATSSLTKCKNAPIGRDSASA